jgi:hypothetical protein
VVNLCCCRSTRASVFAIGFEYVIGIDRDVSDQGIKSWEEVRSNVSQPGDKPVGEESSHMKLA